MKKEPKAKPSGNLAYLTESQKRKRKSQPVMFDNFIEWLDYQGEGLLDLDSPFW